MPFNPQQYVAQPYANATLSGVPAGSAVFAMPPGFINIAVVAEYGTTPTGTSPTDSITLQGSIDGTNWANIGSAVASWTTTAAPVLSPAALFTNIFYPYLRILHTLGGTTPVYAGVTINVYAY